MNEFEATRRHAERRAEFWHNLDSQVKAMCPAAPGTYRLEIFGREILRHNVVAWVIAGKESFLIPMTVDGCWVSNCLEENDAILFPDGHVEEHNVGCFANEFEWLQAKKLNVA